ncbi:PREDICTED: eukaryotic translation initiation factor 5B-like [Amphimedon queenslandica]|uniref:Eukaryotic translation initiation factor 5B n=1 Tax=Amphimedon queenslandica TaxID=400682 RepID=A0A1X7VPF3_AMPQE|nr:PREDICTED: eukaryotic translation initiation factor 5B-like [Amphimedon queenslandica]|eukprot:XP_019859915.1 PREDICTED: eukaryotic translation initiation factor 5B-like [Amphimedon queenslandica]
MGKKKGKKQDENWGETASGGLDIASSVDAAVDSPVQLQQQKGGGGGKKGKKKKQFDDDDIESELLAIANEDGLDVTGNKSEKEAESSNNATEISTVAPEPVLPPAKKSGKKSRKKDKDWDDDDILQELEQLSLESSMAPDSTVPSVSDPVSTSGTSKSLEQHVCDDEDTKKTGKKGKKGKKTSEIDQLVQAIESSDVIPKATPTEASPTITGEQDSASQFHIKTKSEKKEAKKEKERRQKELKKQPKLADRSDIETIALSTSNPLNDKPASVDDSATTAATCDPDPPKPSSPTVELPSANDPLISSTQTIEDDVGQEEEDDKDDDKKKKKKKKKKGEKEEDKKAAKAKKVKSAVQKMKEEIEALRQAQRKREEEELAKVRAAEEAERLRLEKIRLEQEKKERKKQKEKEKRERLKKEGKLLSKSEKERRARANVHLQALVAQGMIVPQKSDSGEKKGPVRYGSKIKKQKRPEQATVSSPADESESLIDEGISSVSEGASVITEEEEDVKESWEDADDVEEEEEEDIVADDLQGDDEKSPPDTLIAITDPVPEATEYVASCDKAVDSDDTVDEDSDSDSTSEDEEESEDLTPYDKANKRIKERRSRYQNERSPDLLRSPVVCVLGHVDTGKTKILDKIRHTHVQDGEAGGITQQIGATFVPPDAIMEQTKMMKEFSKNEMKVPGLLIIDTPGHESFSNLRTRGSSMCDIAILVVDIMHGLEPQTIESLNLLRKGNVPFVVALNKIDRLYNWLRNPTSSVKDTLKKQKQNTKAEFDERVQSVILQFAEQGVNAALYWDKVDFKEYIALVPTSAHSGDGMGDLISLIVSHSEEYLTETLMFSKEVEAIVLEVKVIGGLGTTVDVILRNGILNEGDTLILVGIDGPFVTQARALLMPQPLRELRVKNAYINHKTIIASQGVKITGKDLEKALAGMPVLVAKKPDEIDVLKDEAASMMSSLLNTFKLSERGVFVQASTLGSLEALVDFLKSSKIPYAGVNIGPVHKKDVMKTSVMLERDSQWACILAFDVKVERDAQELADSLGVRIFTADIIYHLFDSFMKYREELKERKRRENEHIATFPCKLKILPNCVFNARNPIIVGVTVVAGIIKPGTPIVVPSKEFVHLGTVSSIEINHKPVDIARKGSEVCVKIEPTSGDAPKLFGRHFDYDDLLVSKISRESIDAVKKYFREDLQKADWQLMVELKKLFQVY